MNENEIIIGHKYLFLDWYRQKVGELEPVVEVEITKIIPEHRSDYFLKAISYEAVDNKGVKHYLNAVSLRPLDWIDDREKPIVEQDTSYLLWLEDNSE